MRTLSAAAAAARATSAQADFVRVLVKDAGGTWRDLSTYAGANALQAVNWGESVSDPHCTADVTLVRELFKLSYSPWITASAINKGFVHTATADPLLQLNREFRIEAAVMPLGKQPDAGDWLIVFHGRIDNIDPGGDRLKFGGRDLAGRLADQQIKKEIVYALAVNGGAAVPLRPWEPGMVVDVGEFCLPASRGDDDPGQNSFHGCITAGTAGNTEPVWDTTGSVIENDGTVQWQKIGSLTSVGLAVEQVIQNIITTSRSSADALVTLYTPISPGWAIREFIQSRDKCLSAIRALAQQIGWDVRMKWHEGTAAFRLTLFEPERTKTTADATFTASQYLSPSKFETAIDNIRNAWTIRFSDSGDLWPDGSPKRKEINVSDSASIAKYGELWAEIQEATASNIDSSTEATKMVQAALDDCSEPTADFAVELAGGFPWVELGDLYAFDADGLIFDTQQKMAVTKWSQSFDGGKLKTSLELRGKPSMGANRWISVTTTHPVITSAAGLFGDGRKVAPPASLYSGIKTVKPVPVPTPGGLDVVLSDSSVDKLREQVEYEVHVHASDPAFVPDDTTLKAVTSARRVSLQGFTGGEEMNIKVVPRSLSRGRMVRGQPSANVASAAGMVTADLIDAGALGLATETDLLSEAFARAAADGTHDARLAVLEAQPDAFPLNGGFEIYDSGAGTFTNWTGTFDGTGVDPTAGRYMQLGTTARSVDSAEFAVAAGYNTLRVLARRPSGTGTSGSVRVRWYDASHTFLSQSSLSIVTAVANAWEWSVLALTAPSNAVYAVVRVTNEGSVTLQYGGVLISQPSFVLGNVGSSPSSSAASYDGRTLTLQPADATRAGVIAASGSQSVGAQLQLPAGSTVAPYESWVNLTLNTNWSVWTTFGTNYGFARYRRDALGHVELEVQVRFVGSGTAAWSGAIGSLPSGYRPQVKHRVCADSGRSSGANDSYCSIDIDNVTGNLTVINNQQNSGTTYTWVCFHARFRSDT